MSFVNFIISADTHGVARPDFALMPQQALMEVLVDGLPDKDKFQGPDGLFIDVCEWQGVTCNEEKVISQVRWDVRFKPFFPRGGSIDLRWIPRTLIFFSVTLSSIQGTLDLSSFHEGLYQLILKRNRFSGSADLTELPATLYNLRIQMNRLSGTLNLTLLPDGLKWLLAEKNRFEGFIDLRSLPQGMVELSLGDNKLSGTIDLSALPPSCSAE